MQSGNMCGYEKPSYTDQPKQLSAVSQFQMASERIEKALCRLREAVGHIGDSFQPVIKPCAPIPCCDNIKDEAQPKSDFTVFIETTERRIHGLAQDIDDICERSVV